jgi:L-ascorbate oxidase
MLYRRAFFPVFSCFALLAASHRISIHDKTFTPDLVLRITLENVTQDCVATKPVALVNGTSPGPALYLDEERTTWIRVYNDMSDQNLTMVRRPALGYKPG